VLFGYVGQTPGKNNAHQLCSQPAFRRAIEPPGKHEAQHGDDAADRDDRGRE
jgi:hypothetical protein